MRNSKGQFMKGTRSYPQYGFKKGNKNWSEGLTKETDERVKRIADLRKGVKREQSVCKQMSESRLRGIKEGTIKVWNKGLEIDMSKYPTMGHRVKHKKESIDQYKEKRKNWITPKKDTLIEVKIQNFLKELKIEFLTHQYMHIEHGYQCDILIPSLKIVIECFGDYWHKYPLARPIDNLRCKELRENGYKVLVFWEREIKAIKIDDLKIKLNQVGGNRF